jgi:hypothetical protein
MLGKDHLRGGVCIGPPATEVLIHANGSQAGVHHAVDTDIQTITGEFIGSYIRSEYKK